MGRRLAEAWGREYVLIGIASRNPTGPDLHVITLDGRPSYAVRGFLLPRITDVRLERMIERGAINILCVVRKVITNRRRQAIIVRIRHFRLRRTKLDRNLHPNDAKLVAPVLSMFIWL